MRSSYSILLQKRAVIRKVWDTLAVANSTDSNVEEIKSSLVEAWDEIKGYPGFETLRRAVLKKTNPDHYAVMVETLLCKVLERETPAIVQDAINEALGVALELLQKQIEVAEGRGIYD